MSEQEIYKLHADFCKFMGNPKRIEIIFMLGEGEKCVDEIAKEMKSKMPNISQHLAMMRDRNIVKTRRDGVKLYYSLSNPKILKACIIMRDLMIQQLQQKANIINKNYD